MHGLDIQLGSEMLQRPARSRRLESTDRTLFACVCCDDIAPGHGLSLGPLFDGISNPEASEPSYFSSPVDTHSPILSFAAVTPPWDSPYTSPSFSSSPAAEWPDSPLHFIGSAEYPVRHYTDWHLHTLTPECAEGGRHPACIKKEDHADAWPTPTATVWEPDDADDEEEISLAAIDGLFDAHHAQLIAPPISQAPNPPTGTAQQPRPPTAPPAAFPPSTLSSDITRRRQRRRLPQDEAGLLTCKTCGKRFHKCYNLQKHQTTHNKDRTRPFACAVPACKQDPFDRKYDLDRHMATAHASEKSFECEFCHGRYGRRDTLRRHVEKACKKRRAVMPPGAAPS